MRILTIGLGGAGCRIVNSLYSTDRRSSKVTCVEALAIDVNADTLAQLSGLPEGAKLYFPPLDPEIHYDDEINPTATIDIGEIIARIQNIESGETDAIFVCCGLGGSMVDVAPHIITTLRATMVEPIFGLVTLPCLAEGERRSSKAADDIEMLSPLVDGIILFDNETWYKKIKALKATLTRKDKGWAEKLGFRKSEKVISPELATYELLNEAIVKRISLILRAGEFMADGGLDHAEVVLDSGEVLNTMKGMGFITIGYAVERLPHNPLNFLTSLRPAVFFADEHNKKASRIVDLAKQAIYHEISTPCDMTSAHKALILIAGPSHELSLKGFMTVRKWIDRSIAGLETRSGDYPVMNTKNVAIIIMLSGLENIPRITELKEIQSQYKSRRDASDSSPRESGTDATLFPETHGVGIRKTALSKGKGREAITDEMLILPGRSGKKEKILIHEPEKSADYEEGDYASAVEETPQEIAIQYPFSRTIHSTSPDAEKKITYHPPVKPSLPPEATSLPVAGQADGWRGEGSSESRHPVAGKKVHTEKPAQSAPQDPSQFSRPPKSFPIKKPQEGEGPKGSDEKTLPRKSEGRLKPKGIERQIIEKELHRQRMMAISGRTPKTGSEPSKISAPPHEIIRLKREVQEKAAQKRDDEQPDIAQETQPVAKKRRVLIQKKTVHPVTPDTKVYDEESRNSEDEEISRNNRSSGKTGGIDTEDFKVGIKKSVHRSKDHVFEGKGIRKAAAPQVKDSVLIHTSLKSKKSVRESINEENSDESGDREDESSAKREKRTTKKDDINWI